MATPATNTIRDAEITEYALCSYIAVEHGTNQATITNYLSRECSKCKHIHAAVCMHLYVYTVYTIKAVHGQSQEQPW